jgi:hypothetical protein
MIYGRGADLSEHLKRYSYFPKFTHFLFGEFGYSIRYRGYMEKEDLILISRRRSFFRLTLKKERWGKETRGTSFLKRPTLLMICNQYHDFISNIYFQHALCEQGDRNEEE